MRESLNLLSFRPMILPLLLRTGISSTQPLSIYSSPWSAMSAANGREIGFSYSGKRYSPKPRLLFISHEAICLLIRERSIRFLFFVSWLIWSKPFFISAIYTSVDYVFFLEVDRYVDRFEGIMAGSTWAKSVAIGFYFAYLPLRF